MAPLNSFQLTFTRIPAIGCHDSNFSPLDLLSASGILVFVKDTAPRPTAMGGLCSKSANEADPFTQPGRVLGNDNAQPSSAPTPRRITSTTPGRTLGGTERASAADDARSAAARAAEVLESAPSIHPTT